MILTEVPREVSATEPQPSPAGKRVALAESRQLDELAALLQQEGCVPLRYPLVDILDPDDWSETDAWLDKLFAGEFADVLFYTGEGVNRLLARAKQRDHEEGFVNALRQARLIIRGPKPARALRELGLAATLSARPATTEGLVSVLADTPLAGHKIGVQLYPHLRSTALLEFLEQAQAKVTTVTPYCYAPDSHADQVAELIQLLDAGGVDVIAFTSASQVDRLWSVAESRGLLETLIQGLKRVYVAAVGPVTAQALTDRQIQPAIAPESSFFMRPLVKAIASR